MNLKVTPSSFAKSEKKINFQSFITALQLGNTPYLANLANKCEIAKDDSSFQECELKFDKDKNEHEYYNPIIEYLTKIGYKNSHIVADGQFLLNSNLFDVDLYTLRGFSRVSINDYRNRDYNESPRLIYHLTGRTDIVILKEEMNISKLIAPADVSICIEVKPTKLLSGEQKINECLREAFLQLVGVNTNNLNASPCVILTDTAKVNYILYLIRKSRPQKKKYLLKITKFDSFSATLDFVKREGLDTRKPFTFDFCRAPSLSDIRDAIAEEESNDSSNEDYDGKVLLSTKG